MSHFGGPDPSKGRLQEVVHPHPHGAPASLGRSRQNPYPGLRRGLDLPFGLVSATLDPGALHRLATNVCLAGGGDGDAVYWSAEVIGDARAGRLLANRLVDAIGAAGTVAPFREGRITLHDEWCLTLQPKSVYLVSQDALIQSGGGTGPSKPRQPSFDGANA